jgi:peptidoglycan hydrolase-like protein with peptidoglycan-binding domain
MSAFSSNPFAKGQLMTRFKTLTLASAVAAAFAVPAVLAQQPGANDSSNQVQQRDATGNPNASPTQPPRSTSSSDRGMNDPTMRSGSASRGDRTMTHGQYDSSTVRNVQQALQSKGYDVGSVDGVMGPKTQSALREFQQQQGLTRSGRIDQQTLSALDVQSSGATGRAGTMGDRAGDRAAGTGASGSGAIGSSPSGSGAPPSSPTSGTPGSPSGSMSGTTPGSTSGTTPPGSSSGATPGASGTGASGSGAIGSSPSGSGSAGSGGTTGGTTGGGRPGG